MAWMANQWAPQLGERTFPGTLDELIDECADNGQKRPTPLILQYGKGDYACLHQDIYGDVVFPLQIAVMLNRPGEDFTGGENVFVEQRPRFQSRAMVVKPRLGQAMIFPVRHRPIRGKNGFRRHAVRHGTNAVESGQRNTRSHLPQRPLTTPARPAATPLNRAPTPVNVMSESRQT